MSLAKRTLRFLGNVVEIHLKEFLAIFEKEELAPFSLLYGAWNVAEKCIVDHRVESM